MKRRRRIASVVCAVAPLAIVVIGCTGDPGPQGDPGARGDQGQVGSPGAQGSMGTPAPDDPPNVSAVTPSRAFLGRTTEITISGDATRWTNAVTADFGPSIEVKQLIVASPSSLVATITLDESAIVGPRDVTIKDGKQVITYKGAFKVEPPLTNPILNGNVAQGSVLLGRFTQKDLTTPFDIARDNDDNFANLVLASGSGSGIDFRVTSAQPYFIDFLALVDVTAPATDTDVRVKSGPSDNTEDSLAPQVFKIAPRTPMEISGAAPVTTTVVNAFDSTLYSYTSPGKSKVVTIDMTWTSKDAAPTISLLPESGKFQDAITLDDTHAGFATVGAEKYYVVLWDGSGQKGYDVTLTLKEVDSGEVEPNNACASAQPVAALPAALEGLSLASDADEDWFAITAAEADVGKAVHVITTAGDPNTDTVVDVFAADCTTSLGGPGSDGTFHSDFTSSPIPAAGTYFVLVKASADGTRGKFYNLSIRLE